MDQTIKALIFIHAFFGGVALVAGLINLIVVKGGSIHKRAGKIFTYSMITSALISLVVSRLPDHENLFLFLIGIFTIYMIMAGNRALTLKRKTQADWIDKLVSGTMLVTSVGMLTMGLVGVFQRTDNSILYIFFGSFGAFLAINDFKTFRVFSERKNAWLISHIGRMVGALIASVTAFLVAGLNIGTILVWILPTILGTAYIVYWSTVFRNGKTLKVH